VSLAESLDARTHQCRKRRAEIGAQKGLMSEEKIETGMQNALRISKRGIVKRNARGKPRATEENSDFDFG